MHPMQSETSTDEVLGNQFPPTSPALCPLDAPAEEYISAEDWVDLVDLNRPKESTDQTEHACLSWTACSDDECPTHLSDKQGSGWFPKKENRTTYTPARTPSPASEMSWTPEDHQPPPPPSSPSTGNSSKKNKRRSTGGKWAKIKKEKTVRWADQSKADKGQECTTTTHTNTFETKATLWKKIREMEITVLNLQKDLKNEKALAMARQQNSQRQTLGATTRAATLQSRNNELERENGELQRALAKEKFARREERKRVRWAMEDLERLHKNMSNDHYGEKYPRTEQRTTKVRAPMFWEEY